jgi:hypothetical protein
MVDVAVGSNGYRSAYVASELPVGKTGTATIAVGETRFDGRAGGRFAGPYGGPQTRQSLALGLMLGGADTSRCRMAPDDAGTPRDPRFDGGQRPCRVTEPPPGP